MSLKGWKERHIPFDAILIFNSSMREEIKLKLWNTWEMEVIF